MKLKFRKVKNESCWQAKTGSEISFLIKRYSGSTDFYLHTYCGGFELISSAAPKKELILLAEKLVIQMAKAYRKSLQKKSPRPRRSS